MYLAGVVDLYSRMVVGWSMSNRIAGQLTLDALNQALGRRRPKAGLHTAVCNPQADASAFTEDAACTGNLVTEGTEAVWNRGHYGPSFIWYNPEPTSVSGKPFTWRYVMLFIASTGGNDSLGLGYSDDGIDWWLYGDTPVISGLIDPQDWEGANGFPRGA